MGYGSKRSSHRTELPTLRVLSLVGAAICVAWLAAPCGYAQPPQREPYVTPLTFEQMAGKQLVLDTDLGAVVIDLRPELAPNHVGLVMRLVDEAAYNGTIFHRIVKHGVIQGGDPLTRDPTRADVYGRGGLGLVAAEFSAAQHLRGTVSAVLVPSQQNSGGSQFFICVVEQPSLDGRHTIWGQVREGMDVVTKISETPVDTDGRALERATVRLASIRDAPPPEPVPFTTESDEELGSYRAILETDVGSITIDFYTDRAPNHVRNFLRLAEAGVYDGMAFHRVVKGFVIQSGHLPSRSVSLTERQQQLIRTLEPEFSDTPHVKGIVSMARGDDPASASTSFFIVTGAAEKLDRQYTAFGVVVDGLDVVEAIEETPSMDEIPGTRIAIQRVRVVRR
jgi:peptidyl-prolyl cis-trans isomerase B (cyclophilin B)